MGLFMAVVADSHRFLDYSGFVRRCVWPCFSVGGILTHINRDIFVRVSYANSELYAGGTTAY